MKEIPLTRGNVAFVDDEDYEALSKYSWNGSCRFYAAAYGGTVNGSRRTILMHRLILGLEHGNPLHVDHIDGNRTNNQKSNLRTCTRTQNLRNKKKMKSNTSGLKGVSWSKRSGKWMARIRWRGKDKFLGQSADPQEMHELYCLAAVLLHGEFANFG